MTFNAKIHVTEGWKCGYLKGTFSYNFECFIDSMEQHKLFFDSLQGDNPCHFL